MSAQTAPAGWYSDPNDPRMIRWWDGNQWTHHVQPRPAPEPAATVTSVVSACVYAGDEDLEVVGESNYQDSLWAICGARAGDRVRHDVIAALVPEPSNPYDPNAISVHIDGHIIGYLPRAIAAQYIAGLHQLMEESGSYVALNGVIVGGGQYADGQGKLGVWLDHDPADFGVERSSARPRGSAASTGSMRTGFSEAWLTDVQDDSYDLSWFDTLPDADRPAIEILRNLLRHDPDPIDRHFQFAELETRLYRCRDLYESALDEYDQTCQQHDAEMETICQAFLVKWGKVPLLETYRQMAIRQQKRKDWQACLWWTERGLALYGSSAAREDAVEDLIKRRNRAASKLESPPKQSSPPKKIETMMANSSGSAHVSSQGSSPELEILVCSSCQSSFERLRVRGRKPLLCPTCRVQ